MDRTYFESQEEDNWAKGADVLTSVPGELRHLTIGDSHYIIGVIGRVLGSNE